MPDSDGRDSKRRFASALALLTFLAGLTTAGYCIYAWFTARGDQLAQLDTLAQFAARSSNFFFDQFGVGLRTLGQNILAHGGLSDLPEAHRMIDRYRRQSAAVARVNVFSIDGSWLLSSNKPAGTRLPSAHELPHWEEDMRAALGVLGLSIGRPVPGILSPARIIPLRQTVRDTAGRIQFVLSAVIPLDNQQEIWNKLDFPADGVVGLVRDDGYLQSLYPAFGSESHMYEQPLSGQIFRGALDQSSPPNGHVEGASPLDGQYRL